MKLLVATRALLGMKGRQNDVWDNPRLGELVIPPFAVQVPLGAYADDEDGIARSFFALSNGARTSVAQVKDIPVSEDAYRTQLATFVEQVVFKSEPLAGSYNLRKVVERHYRKLVEDLTSVRFGDLVEIRDGRIGRRILTPAQR